MTDLPGTRQEPARDVEPDRGPTPGRSASPLAVAGVVLGGLLLLGVLCGVLWWLLVEPAVFTKVRGSGGSMNELELAKRFATDGWYAVIAVLAGFVAGGALVWWRRSEVVGVVLLLLPGAVVAAAAMLWTGRVLGPADPQTVLRTAPPGALVPVQLDVASWTAYLAWPVGLLVGALVVLWSLPPDGRADAGAAEQGPVEDSAAQA